MKNLLMFTCPLVFLACTGCLVDGGPYRHGGHHGGYHGGYYGRSEVIVRQPAVIVPAPVVVVPVPVIPVPRIRVRVD